MMLYPVYIHKDENSCYGVTIPDLPGCFAACDQLDELQEVVMEAVQAHFHGEAVIAPEPTAIERLHDHPDYEEGFWMMVDLDWSRLNQKSVRLNISLPENLVKQIDDVATHRHLSRSAFLALAAKKEILTAV